ncbi:hypothetical protein H0H92_011648 [Tricholoma furcatifolium]|nr:hypothetical protein H0H92_011648 [Tricholoma furcatifolium]
MEEPKGVFDRTPLDYEPFKSGFTALAYHTPKRGTVDQTINDYLDGMGNGLDAHQVSPFPPYQLYTFSTRSKTVVADGWIEMAFASTKEPKKHQISCDQQTRRFFVHFYWRLFRNKDNLEAENFLRRELMKRGYTYWVSVVDPSSKRRVTSTGAKNLPSSSTADEAIATGGGPGFGGTDYDSKRFTSRLTAKPLVSTEGLHVPSLSPTPCRRRLSNPPPVMKSTSQLLDCSATTSSTSDAMLSDSVLSNQNSVTTSSDLPMHVLEECSTSGKSNLEACNTDFVKPPLVVTGNDHFSALPQLSYTTLEAVQSATVSADICESLCATLSSNPSTDRPTQQVYHKMPLPHHPPIWAKVTCGHTCIDTSLTQFYQSRQEVCESFDWFRSYQGGVYYHNDYAKGYLLGGRDIFEHGGRLIISHGGGKAESTSSHQGKSCLQPAEDQLAQDKSVRALLTNYRECKPLALLIDDRYALFPYDLASKEIAYAVLGFYTISHAWANHEELIAEKQPIGDGQRFVVRYKFAFQWCDGQV